MSNAIRCINQRFAFKNSGIACLALMELSEIDNSARKKAVAGYYTARLGAKRGYYQQRITWIMSKPPKFHLGQMEHRSLRCDGLLCAPHRALISIIKYCATVARHSLGSPAT